MKSKLLRLAAVLGLASATLGVSNCKGRHGIVILPSPHTHQKLEKNWTAIQKKLKTYDKGVFRIQYYNEGRPVGEPDGKMPEFLLERSVDEFNRIAKVKKYTGHAVQIGIGLSEVEVDYRYVGGYHEGDLSAAAYNSHHIQAFSRGSSHAHLVHLFDQSAEAVKAIAPVVDESDGSGK